MEPSCHGEEEKEDLKQEYLKMRSRKSAAPEGIVFLVACCPEAASPSWLKPQRRYEKWSPTNRTELWWETELHGSQQFAKLGYVVWEHDEPEGYTAQSVASGQASARVRAVTKARKRCSRWGVTLCSGDSWWDFSWGSWDLRPTFCADRVRLRDGNRPNMGTWGNLNPKHSTRHRCAEATRQWCKRQWPQEQQFQRQQRTGRESIWLCIKIIDTGKCRGNLGAPDVH